jgi:hypothetical protein
VSAPVFVIHGIGARDAEPFAETARALGKAAGFAAFPVFWGDLGARTEMVERTVPGAPEEELRDGETSDTDLVMAEFLASGGRGGSEIRGDDEALPAEVLEAVLGREIRETPDARDIERALREEWSSTRWLSITDDPEVLRAIGEALAGPLTGEDALLLSGFDGGTEIRGVDVAGFVKRRLQELDHVVGAALGAAAGRLNSQVRSSMLPGITQYVGDILVYQRHRERIQDRVREVVAGVDPDLGRSREHPVDAVAHSLGGVIAVDMAIADDPLWVRNLVTFGSQSPFFHVCDPRGGRLTPFNGSALVRLPPSLGRWTNLWEPLDVLAFIAARVFVLHDGSAPDDRAVPHLVSSGLWSHSAYWTLPSVADAVARALRPTE